MHIVLRAFRKACALYRRAFYRFLSDAKVLGRPLKAAPVLARGQGTVFFEKEVHVGLECDTDFWTSYVFLNPRTPDARIEVGENSWLGNHFVAISEGPGISIGKNVLIGTHVEIYDSDFHAVASLDRFHSTAKRLPVRIADRVWIGNNVTILKGTEIGENSVVAAGAVVSGKFPTNVLLGGVPARVIRKIEFSEGEKP